MILIAGPTAGGKSAFALEIAKQVDGVVINADSMQVYDTLRVLTARPSADEMDGVPHLLYGHVRAGAHYSTGAWLRDVAAVLARLRDEGRKAILVGGTGLYFRALTEGLAEMPEIPEAIRTFWRDFYAGKGAESLHSALAERDPAMAGRLNVNDAQRIIRALEVFDASGRSIATFQAETPPPLVNADRAAKFIILPPRPLLHERINRRFEMMFDAGAVEEVETLLGLGLDRSAMVMRAIGVSEIGGWLKGELSREETIERAQAATRQYAKRQMTWFRNQMDERWLRVNPLADEA